MDTIFLRDMVLSARIGCREKEQEIRQPIRMDIEMKFDTRKSGQSDRLSDTIDYVRAFQLIENRVNNQSYRLLEHLCECISNDLLQLGVASVRIRASKDRCPIAGFQGNVGVDITRP